MELKHTGQISTLSEERVGELMSYRDIIPKDAEGSSAPVPNTVHYAGAAPPQRTRQNSTLSQSSSQATSSDELDAPAPRQQNGGTVAYTQQNQSYQNSSRSTAQPVQKAHHTPVNAAPPPVRATSPVASYSRGGPVKSGAVTTESIIERELREQREREEELRWVVDSREMAWDWS